MIVGQVVGTVVSTKKDEKLEGLKFLIVGHLDLNGKPTGSYVVAIDSVGAGVGEVVLCAAGSSARQTQVNERPPRGYSHYGYCGFPRGEGAGKI